MAFTSIFDLFNKGKRVLIEDGDGQALIFDATTSESHKDSSKLTKHPIEDGGTITDHIIPDPLSLKIASVQSDHPISILSSLATAGSSFIGNQIGGIGGAAASFGGSQLAAVLLNGTNSSRSQTAYQMLLSWKSRGIPLTVTTKLRTYTSMALTSISSDRDAQNSNSLDVSLVFEELLIATTVIAAIPDDLVAHTATPEKDTGAKDTGLAGDAAQKAAERPDGITKSLFDLLGITP